MVHLGRGWNGVPGAGSVLQQHKHILKNENFKMFEDERSTKTFLTLENCKSSYNNVSHLTVEEEIIDDSTSPPVKTIKNNNNHGTKKNSRGIPS